MRTLKQIFCNHYWGFVAKNSIVNEVLEQCTKCKCITYGTEGLIWNTRQKEFPDKQGLGADGMRDKEYGGLKRRRK